MCHLLCLYECRKYQLVQDQRVTPTTPPFSKASKPGLMSPPMSRSGWVVQQGSYVHLQSQLVFEMAAQSSRT